MKAMVVSPVGGRVPPTRGVLHNGLGLNGGGGGVGGGGGGGVGGGGGGGVGGGVGGGSRRDMEAEEVAAYLTKLRSLVPDMPRKRKLSKLEVIQRVIEYICDLQTTLEETNNVPINDINHHSTSSSPSSSPIHNNFNIQQQQRSPLQPLLNSSSSSITTNNPGSIAMITSTMSMSTNTTTTTTTTTITTNDESLVSYQR